MRATCVEDFHKSKAEADRPEAAARAAAAVRAATSATTTRTISTDRQTHKPVTKRIPTN